MKKVLWAVGVLLGGVLSGRADEPVARGLENPESVAVTPDGKVYVTTIGAMDREGDGTVVVVQGGKQSVLVRGLDDPKGIAAFQKWLFVCDRQRVLRIELPGKVEEYAGPKAFPAAPINLNDVAVDPESGTVYVSDSGDRTNRGGAVYRISPKREVTVVTSQQRWPGLERPNGLALDGASHLLLADSGSGKLHRLRLADGKREELAEGLGHADGIAWDMHGRLFLSDWKGGRVRVIPRPGLEPVLLKEGLQSAADLAYDPVRRMVLVPDMKAGTVTALPAAAPGYEVDETPMPVEVTPAFADLQWAGWKGETEQGLVIPLRPIVLTHAGDGSKRVFVATQRGVIHVFPNDQKATKTKVFLDIEKKVSYTDKQNEEGFLGLAFAPDYRKSGELYVFYTPRDAKLVNVLSRFRVSKDDPDRADPASEEEILRIQRPFWNHDGGTLCFGPDGYLYVALGDGGSGGDPYNNGQNLKTLLGTILRIDVRGREGDRAYRIPADNPFAGRDDARGEIWAYGLRNVWRMAFDRKTGVLWAGEVGQNLYEEINRIEKGGNYGWKLRESLHPFGPGGSGVREGLIDPIWEYHHDVGKSITGGGVYRGKRLPELDGMYVYGDYVSGRIWALGYDEKAGRVVANRPIRARSMPILSFGEDEEGEIYLLTYSPTGRGIYRLVRTAGAEKR